ncbi:hypothetical protein HmCmsJML031_01034 [Escherichia coli]|nr:hypothetical protein HmCmsJML031_01034 [Escherichia coli]
MFILHEVVFGEKNEEDASSHRNVSFTYSGGDVKLIYNRNNLHIKQLDDFFRFLIFLCLKKNTEIHFFMDYLGPIFIEFFFF